MSHLNFLNDDDKRRRREEEIKGALLKINKKIEKTKPHNYYNDDDDLEDDEGMDYLKPSKPSKKSNYQEEKPEIAIDKTVHNTSFSPKSNDEASVFKMLSAVFGVCLIITASMLIFGSTFGFFKEPSTNITCAPSFLEGNTSVHCSDVSAPCTCPAINLSTVCGSVTNYTSYYYNYTTNHT